MKIDNFLSFTAGHLVFKLDIIFGYINKPRKAGKMSEKSLFVSNFNFDSFIKVMLKIASTFRMSLLESGKTAKLTREGSTLSNFVYNAF